VLWVETGWQIKAAQRPSDLTHGRRTEVTDSLSDSDTYLNI